MDADCPAVQVVPAATGMIADQVPLAHCWKEVPPMQFHSPSLVQGLPAVWAPTVPVVPVLAGGAAEATDEAAGADPFDAAGAAEGAAVADGDASLAAEETVAKTPPGTAAGEEEAGAVADVTAGATDVALDGDEPPAVGDAPATLLPQAPPLGATGVMVAKPSCSTESPGAGKARSAESTV